MSNEMNLKPLTELTKQILVVMHGVQFTSVPLTEQRAQGTEKRIRQSAVHGLDPMVVASNERASISMEFHNTCLEQATRQYNELAVKYNDRNGRIRDLEQSQESLWAANDSQRKQLEQLQDQVRDTNTLREKDFIAFASTKNDLERDLKASNEQLDAACRERDAKNKETIALAAKIREQDALIQDRQNDRETQNAKNLITASIIGQAMDRISESDPNGAQDLLIALKKVIAG